jgi:hypothetical protein
MWNLIGLIGIGAVLGAASSLHDRRVLILTSRGSTLVYSQRAFAARFCA